MDHALFYGILGVSVVFGALMYHANMAETVSNEGPAAPDSSEATRLSQTHVEEADQTLNAPDRHLPAGLPSLVSVR